MKRFRTLHHKTGLLLVTSIGLAIAGVLSFFTATRSKSELMVDEEIKSPSSQAKYNLLQVDETLEVATFAGGCFWCIEAALQPATGVVEVFSGFTGGVEVNPSYESVVQGKTGHREAVSVYFNPDLITYQQLVTIFWQQIDPTDDGGQFSDRGYSYTTAIYYHSDQQKKVAETTKTMLSQSGEFENPLVTEILPFTTFYLAEDYHQDYFEKNRQRYKRYEQASGRKDFVESRQ